MVDLKKLKYSLTKFGAHKLVGILAKYDSSNVLKHLADVPGDKIDLPVARGVLTADKEGNVPAVWDKVRLMDQEAIRSLVLLGVVFGHHRLIAALRAARTKRFKGTVKRGSVLTTRKEFTNVKRVLLDLGSADPHTASPSEVAYDFKSVFAVPGLPPLAAELLTHKLKAAGWDSARSPIDAMIAAGFHEVLSVSKSDFAGWLSDGSIEARHEPLSDADYFVDADDDEGAQATFVFKPGHSPKKTGTVSVTAPKTDTKADLLHNELQTALYNQLVQVHGAACVGTEQQTGHGTSIDLVVKKSTSCSFYEIKVAKSLKACIRQALPQLLEYAYWRADNGVADRLCIATKFKLSKDAAKFLELLRTRFSLPLHYERIVLSAKKPKVALMPLRQKPTPPR